jgi:phage shock protein A
MKLLTQIKLTVKSKIRNITNYFTNPGEMANEAVEKLKQDKQGVINSLTEVLTELKVMETKLNEEHSKKLEWHEKAKLAVRKDKPELAAAALTQEGLKDKLLQSYMEKAKYLKQIAIDMKDQLRRVELTETELKVDAAIIGVNHRVYNLVNSISSLNNSESSKNIIEELKEKSQRERSRSEILMKPELYDEGARVSKQFEELDFININEKVEQLKLEVLNEPDSGTVATTDTFETDYQSYFA